MCAVDPGNAPAPLALILVRNTVTHDARILREARTLGGLGYQVLIAGVVSTAERERRLELEGTAVVRLDPASALRRSARAISRRGRVRGPGALSRVGGPGAIAGGVKREAQPREAQPRATAKPAARGAATLRRLAMTAAYYLQGVLLVRRTSPVLVHANDYNTMWIGIAAKLLRRSHLVYDCHELWADRNGRPEWRPWLVACEALFVRIADVTITTSPGYALALARRYRIAEPMLVRNIPPALQTPRNGTLTPRAGEMLAVYVGGLMPGRGLEQAIQALALIPEARMRFVGPGNGCYVSALLRLAADCGVADRLELSGHVPPDAVTAAIADAQLGLMLIQPVCRSYELTLPNKLFEYAVAGVPILASDLPVIGALVRGEGIGEAVPPEGIKDIAAAIRRVASPELNADLRGRVREFAQRENWERERAKLESVYLEVAGRP